MSFFEEDKVGTLQPHDDVSIVTLKIEGYDVKRVLADQGSDAVIMYPDLFKGLKLRPEDLAYYDSLLIGFNGKIVFSKGQIRLPVQAGSEIGEVNFIVIDAGCILPLYRYCSKTLALRQGGCVLHPTLKSEVSVKGSG